MHKRTDFLTHLPTSDTARLPACHCTFPQIALAMPSSLFCSTPVVTSAIIIVLIALPLNYYSLRPSTCPPLDAQHSHLGYLEYECAGKPHQSSWDAWFHPGSMSSIEGYGNDHQKRAGAVTRDWNILYHLGGNGPWVEKVIDTVKGGIAVPIGCEVEQVHMVGHSGQSKLWTG